MAWTVRGDRRYYYRSRRIGRRVRRIYCGFGPAGELAAGVDRLRRDRQQAARQANSRRMSRAEAADRAVMELSSVAEVLMHAVLVTVGLHLHGVQWRRCRAKKT